MLSVRLSKELDEKLSSLSKKTHRSKSFYVTKALESYLEDRADYALALEAFDEHVAQKKSPISLDDAKKILGIE